MEVVSAREAREAFAATIDKAQRAPVWIEKKGRPVAVLLSLEDFEQMNGAYEREMEALLQDWREKIARIKEEPGGVDGEEFFRKLDEEFAKE